MEFLKKSLDKVRKNLFSSSKSEVKKAIKKKEEKDIKDEVHNITIKTDTGNKKAFNAVVKMFSSGMKERLGIKINPKEFIVEYPFKGAHVLQFSISVPKDASTELKQSFDIIKKNVQLEIKGDKKYKDIQILGVRKRFIGDDKITQLFKIIKQDELFNEHDGPLFLDCRILFYTCVFDYNRFVKLAKELDKHLGMKKINYKDVKKRIIDAVDMINADIRAHVPKKEKATKNQIKNALNEVGEQGGIKLVYMRNYTWEINYELRKKPKDFLKKLAKLFEFMQKTLHSEGQHKDFMFPVFTISTDLDIVSAYGCFAKLNDKTGLDESIFTWEFPTTLRKL